MFHLNLKPCSQSSKICNNSFLSWYLWVSFSFQCILNICLETTNYKIIFGTYQQLRSLKIQWVQVYPCVFLCIYMHTRSCNDCTEASWVLKTLHVSYLPNCCLGCLREYLNKGDQVILNVYLKGIYSVWKYLSIWKHHDSLFSLFSKECRTCCWHVKKKKPTASTTCLQPLNAWQPCNCSLPAGNPDIHTILWADLIRGGAEFNLIIWYSSSFMAVTKRYKWFRSLGIEFATLPAPLYPLALMNFHWASLDKRLLLGVIKTDKESGYRNIFSQYPAHWFISRASPLIIYS